MKKLLILSAMAMSAGAIFADPLASEDFEGMTAGTEISRATITALGDNWVSEVVDPTSIETEATVTAYESGDNKNYLALSTTASLDFYHDTLHATASVATDAIYFDSYVQFSPTDLTWDRVGNATQAGMETGDKIAVWLANIEANDDKEAAATKLMITAGVNTTGDTIDLTNFMANYTVTAGTWYRLTIAATGGKYGENLTTVNFKVYVDGNEVSAFAVAGDGTVGETAQTSFQSAVANDDDISNVGFKGTGAVDTLVWTRDDPFAIEGAEFEIGTKQYPTFAAALAEAESGATIKMIANSETAIEVTAGKNVTLDLNGCTLSAGISNAGTLKLISTSSSSAKVDGSVTNSGTLQIGETDGTYATFIKFRTQPNGATYADNLNWEQGADEYWSLASVAEDPIVVTLANSEATFVAGLEFPTYTVTYNGESISEGYTAEWSNGEDVVERPEAAGTYTLTVTYDETGDSATAEFLVKDAGGETGTDIVVPAGKTAEEVVAEATSATGIAITGDMDDVTISGSTITIGEKTYTVASFYNVTKGENALILTLDETKALATVAIDTESVDEEPFTVDTGVGLRVTVTSEAAGKLYYGLAYATGVSETFAAPTKVVKPSAAGTVNLSADKVVGADAGFYKIWIDDVAPAGATIEE